MRLFELESEVGFAVVARRRRSFLSDVSDFGKGFGGMVANTMYRLCLVMREH